MVRPTSMTYSSALEKRIYRAANARASTCLFGPFSGLRRGRKPTASHSPPTDPPQEGPGRSRDLTFDRRNSIVDQSIGIHSQWIGLVSNALESIAYQWIGNDRATRPAAGRGKRQMSQEGCSLQ